MTEDYKMSNACAFDVDGDMWGLTGGHVWGHVAHLHASCLAAYLYVS